MESKPTLWAEVDEQGRLVLPPEVAARYGLAPGSKARLDVRANDLRMHRPVTHLTKVYIEPTVNCNLDCITCMRNIWDEGPGRMTAATFERIVASLQAMAVLPTVFFGGLGEPLFHPRTIDWVRRVKQLGARVELITNGTMLTEKKARQLIDARLDVLWISLDGATPQSYEDVRLGAELPRVLENLKRFSNLRPGGRTPFTKIGIAFVAMKRNISDLPELLHIGKQVRATYFSVSNVMPYTDELRQEMLFSRTLNNITYNDSPWVPNINVPKMDIDKTTRDSFFKMLNSGYNVTYAGNNLGSTTDVCNFIEGGSISIGWNGDVSPCLPLLHTFQSYLHGKPRLSRKHHLGNIADKDLLEIWTDPEYVAYRERVQRFAFAPCTSCGGCELSEENQEDCFLNPFPACGGCLWAQGVIQCP